MQGKLCSGPALVRATRLQEGGVLVLDRGSAGRRRQRWCSTGLRCRLSRGCWRQRRRRLQGRGAAAGCQTRGKPGRRARQAPLQPCACGQMHGRGWRPGWERCCLPRRWRRCRRSCGCRWSWAGAMLCGCRSCEAGVWGWGRQARAAPPAGCGQRLRARSKASRPPRHHHLRQRQGHRARA